MTTAPLICERCRIAGATAYVHLGTLCIICLPARTAEVRLEMEKALAEEEVAAMEDADAAAMEDADAAEISGMNFDNCAGCGEWDGVDAEGICVACRDYQQLKAARKIIEDLVFVIGQCPGSCRYSGAHLRATIWLKGDNASEGTTYPDDAWAVAASDFRGTPQHYDILEPILYDGIDQIGTLKLISVDGVETRCHLQDCVALTPAAAALLDELGAAALKCLAT